LKSAAALAAAAPAGMQNAVSNQDWLALTKEDALEPQLPIIDPHHHFWNTADRTPQKYRYCLSLKGCELPSWDRRGGATAIKRSRAGVVSASE
jgi:hypothetical protein